MANMIAGRYEILTSLGRGGMGEVFLANDLVLRRRVAIKQILSAPDSGADSVAVERLIREARLGAGIHHPNVVAVHDLIAENDRTYIVMEYLEARSLAEIIRAKKTLDPTTVGKIGAQIAAALEVAHRADITHRDVKPSNILIDSNGVAKLADFGIARRADDPSLTGSGMMIGSIAYMAPEVAKGDHAVTTAADIYSLGSTLFAAIEGHGPFTTDSEPASSVQVLVRLVTLPPPLPPHGGPFSGLIHQMMATNPSERPTAAEVQRKLAILTIEPLASPEEESPGRPSPGTNATTAHPSQTAPPGVRLGGVTNTNPRAALPARWVSPPAAKLEQSSPPSPMPIGLPDAVEARTVLRGQSASSVPMRVDVRTGGLSSPAKKALLMAAIGVTMIALTVGGAFAAQLLPQSPATVSPGPALEVSVITEASATESPTPTHSAPSPRVSQSESPMASPAPSSHKPLASTAPKSRKPVASTAPTTSRTASSKPPTTEASRTAPATQAPQPEPTTTSTTGGKAR